MELGDCYEAAFEFMFERWVTKQPLDQFRLVHGVCVGQGPIEGTLFGHAWIETEVNGVPLVLNVATGAKVTLPKSLYYEMGQVQMTKTYTWAEVKRFVAENNTYGHWELPETYNGQIVH